MSALERLQTHYQSLGTQSVNVSELMGETNSADPLVFFWKALTPKMRMEIDSDRPNDEHPASFAARVVAMLAIDKEGNRLFQTADQAHLRNTVSSHVLQEIAARMISPPVPAKN